MFSLRATKLSAFLLFAFVLGCSEVRFKSSPSESCENYNSQTNGSGDCNPTPEGNHYTITVKAGMVDILFVDDNSGSMYTEQSQMANKFPSFLSSISNLNYQIGITTTDITGSTSNTNELQDGNLIKFTNGSSFIKNSTPDAATLFSAAIKRPETLTCDTSNYKTCPSGDERGIYALNMAFDKSSITSKPHNKFFRKDAHLAVVILSDEDERSNGGQIAGYPLEPQDLPETLVTKLEEKFGSAKMMSVHSVIIRPGDTACFNAQNAQAGVKGFYGTYYAKLSQPSAQLKSIGNIVDGVLGSICAADYGAQLGNIGSKITQNVSKIQLACEPEADSVVVKFDGVVQPQYTDEDVDDSNRLILQPPALVGVTVTVDYDCL